MGWSSRKKKEGIFCTFNFDQRGIFLRLVFYLNVQYIKYSSKVHILSHIKKQYFIDFCCLFLKLSKAFSVSLRLRIVGNRGRAQCSVSLPEIKVWSQQQKSTELISLPVGMRECSCCQSLVITVFAYMKQQSFLKFM